MINNEVCYCTHCGAILNGQEGFDPSFDRWLCHECGQLLTSDEPKGNVKYPGVTWFCDGCDSVLNDQKGFSDDCGEWRCSCCGYLNTISEDEIFDSTMPARIVEMTGDSQKDGELLWSMLDERIHLIDTNCNDFIGWVEDYYSPLENENGLPSISFLERNSNEGLELFSNEISRVEITGNNDLESIIPS